MVEAYLQGKATRLADARSQASSTRKQLEVELAWLARGAKARQSKAVNRIARVEVLKKGAAEVGSRERKGGHHTQRFLQDGLHEDEGAANQPDGGILAAAHRVAPTRVPVGALSEHASHALSHCSGHNKVTTQEEGTKIMGLVRI